MREERAYLTEGIDRRSFLATGAGALAAAAALGDGQPAAPRARPNKRRSCPSGRWAVRALK